MNCASDKKLFKKDVEGIRGYQEWVIDAKAIAPSLSDAVLEGRYYYRNMRINKEIFCALVQHRVEELTNDFNDMDM